MKAVQFQTASGRTIYVEVTEELDVVNTSSMAGGGSIAGEDTASKLVGRLGDLGETIADVCASVQQRVLAATGGAKPTELTLEFGVELAGEGSIPLVTKASAQTTFQVTVKWEFK